MSLMENEPNGSSKNKEYIVTQIAKILREDYKSSGSAIKWIARHTGASEHAVRKWYDAAREPSIENFISLTKASPRLIEWFLNQVGREDLAQLIQKQNQANKSSVVMHDVHLDRLIFETSHPSQTLIKMQKLTLRQLWFYSGIKEGHKLSPHDLISNFGIGRATAYRDIKELCELGLICKIGSDRNEYYTVMA